MRVAFLDRGFELRQVGVAEVVLVDYGIEGVALGLGTAVDGVVFGGGDSLEILAGRRPACL